MPLWDRYGPPELYGVELTKQLPQAQTPLGGLGQAIGLGIERQNFTEYTKGMQQQAEGRFREFGIPEASAFADLLRDNPGLAAQMAEGFGGLGTMERGFRQQSLVKQVIADWNANPPEGGDAFVLYQRLLDAGVQPDIGIPTLTSLMALEQSGAETGLLRAKTESEWAALAGGKAPSFEDLSSIRQKFASHSARNREILQTYQSLPETYDRAITGGEHAVTAQQTLGIKLLKLLDPGSIVSRGEFGLVINSTSLGGQLRNDLQKMISGDLLNKTQIDNLMNQASRETAAAARNQVASMQSQFGLATRYTVNPDDVMEDYVSGVMPGLERFLPDEAKEVRAGLNSMGFGVPQGSRGETVAAPRPLEVLRGLDVGEMSNSELRLLLEAEEQ